MARRCELRWSDVTPGEKVGVAAVGPLMGWTLVEARANRSNRHRHGLDSEKQRFMVQNRLQLNGPNHRCQSFPRKLDHFRLVGHLSTFQWL